MPRKLIVGIDEVGVGAIAGPITVCACYVPNPAWPVLQSWGFTDSKLLTREKRQELVTRLAAEASTLGVKWAISSVEPIQIDALSPNDAQMRAARTAFLLLRHRMDVPLKELAVLVDGNMRMANMPPHITQIAKPKADLHYLPVSVASVIAKETRDTEMDRLHLSFPLYKFDQNKGYPALYHLMALLKRGAVYGVHRKHYLKKILDEFHERIGHYAITYPDWLKNDRWLRNVDDSQVVIDTRWPVFGAES